MQELQQNVDEFQRESKVALEGPHMPSTAKLQQLIDQGQNLGVELSQCKPLKLVINWNCLDTQFFLGLFVRHIRIWFLCCENLKQSYVLQLHYLP